MKISLFALLMCTISISAMADKDNPLIIASINDGYLSQQIVRQKLDEKYYQTVFNESIRSLVVDVSLEEDNSETDSILPLYNVDQPNLRGE